MENLSSHSRESSRCLERKIVEQLSSVRSSLFKRCFSFPGKYHDSATLLAPLFRNSFARRVKEESWHRPPRNETFLHRNYKHRSPNLFSPICSSQSSMRNRCGDRKFVWKPKNGIQGGGTRIRSIRAGAQDFIIQDAAGNGRKNCGRNAAKKQLSKKRSIDDFHRGAPLPPRVPPSEEVSPSLLFPAWINDTVVESGIIEIYVVAGERQGGKRSRRRRARHGWNKKGERKKGERKKEEERNSLGEQVN